MITDFTFVATRVLYVEIYIYCKYYIVLKKFLYFTVNYVLKTYSFTSTYTDDRLLA